MRWNLKKFESTTKAKKVVLVYAEVEHNGVEFRVYPNGFVEQYQHNTWWWEYNTYEDDYDVIQAAGLAAIHGVDALNVDEVLDVLDHLEAAEKAVTEAYRRGYATGQEEVEKERDELRAKIEQQKPVGIVHRYGRALNGSAWLGVAWNPEADELPTGTAIYALPGAKGE